MSITEPSTRRRRPRKNGRPRLPALSQGDIGRIFLLSLFPLGLCLAHLSEGANAPAAAVWLTLYLALSLVVALLIRSATSRVLRSRSMALLAACFVGVILVAACTLIGAAPDPHILLNEAGRTGPISIDRSATIVEIIKLAGLACAFLVGCVLGGSTRRALTTTTLVAVTGALYTFGSLTAYFARGYFAAGERFSSNFLSANSAATLLGVLLVLTVGVMMRQAFKPRTGAHDKSRVGLVFLISCAGFLLFGLLLTASRMGFISTGIAVAALVMWERFAGKRRFGSAAVRYFAIGLVVTIALVIGSDLLWARFGALGEDAANRGVIFSAHWHEYLRSPFFGYGLGSFSTVNNAIITPDNYGALWSIRATHNVYLQWLEEAGVIGFLPMFASVVIIIGMAIRGATLQGPGRTVLRGLVASNIVILMHSTSDYSLQVPSIAATWAFFLGLQFAFGAVQEPQRSSSRNLMSLLPRLIPERVAKAALVFQSTANRPRVDGIDPSFADDPGSADERLFTRRPRSTDAHPVDPTLAATVKSVRRKRRGGTLASRAGTRKPEK